MDECTDVSEISSLWNIVDDVREVMWYFLVGSILCCWEGEKMNEMQCL